MDVIDYFLLLCIAILWLLIGLYACLEMEYDNKKEWVVFSFFRHPVAIIIGPFLLFLVIIIMPYLLI